jgi:hypothetical protein
VAVVGPAQQDQARTVILLGRVALVADQKEAMEVPVV